MIFRDEKSFKKHMHKEGLEKRKINFYFIVSFPCENKGKAAEFRENKCENFRKDGKILTTIYQKQIRESRKKCIKKFGPRFRCEIPLGCGKGKDCHQRA